MIAEKQLRRALILETKRRSISRLLLVIIIHYHHSSAFLPQQCFLARVESQRRLSTFPLVGCLTLWLGSLVVTAVNRFHLLHFADIV